MSASPDPSTVPFPGLIRSPEKSRKGNIICENGPSYSIALMDLMDYNAGCEPFVKTQPSKKSPGF